MGKATVTRDSSKGLDLRAFSARGWFPLVLVLSGFFCRASAHVPPSEKNVLIIESFSVPSLGTADFLKSDLRANSPWPINFYIEYLEGQRFDDQNYEQNVFAALQHTYAGQQMDLVMAESYPALEFVLKYRDQLFPGVPIVFWGVHTSRIRVGQKLGPAVTGVTDNLDPAQTIDLALHLHPETNTVAVITNNSEFERYWLALVHAELVRHQDKLTEIDLVALPTSQLLERVAALPPQTVVLFQEGPQAAIQPVMGAYDILAWVGQRLPTYCVFPITCIDHGGIGGVDSDWEDTQLPVAAGIARRILSGEQADQIPVAKGTGYKARVDWRQLRRWNIAEASLPPGSQVLDREPTLWERYRSYIIAAAVLIFIQSLLIVALQWQRARKRKAEAVLRESEERFRVMANTIPSLIWMCDPAGRIIYLNDRRLAFTGSDPDAGYGDTWTEYVHPDDLKNVLQTFSRSLEDHEPFSKEYRLRRNDGVYRWMFDVASPRWNGDGSFAGFIGSAIDATDQKLAQEALRRVSGRLIEAQEKERNRIARDLHDDISQKLALLSIEIEQAKGSAKGSSAVTKELLAEAQQHCLDIAQDVQSLSHQLHYSKLDYLGIVVALRSFCKELARQHELKIEFQDTNVPSNLPKDVSLCLFRVAQEALHNAVKYSGVGQFIVNLSATEDEVRLRVRDAGVGFDVEAAKRNHGLGLVSMQERMNLVHGRLQIESKPGAGTTITASAPVILFEVIAEDPADRAGSMQTAA